MKIENYVNNITNKIKANQKFEKSITKLQKMLNNGSNKVLLQKELLKLGVEENEYKEIDNNLISKIKKDYYMTQNLEFVSLIITDFKDVKAQLNSLTKTTKQIKNNLNDVKERISIILNHIFNLDSQTSYNDIENVKKFIIEIMQKNPAESPFFNVDLDSDSQSLLPNSKLSRDFNVLEIYQKFVNNANTENKDFISTYFLTAVNDSKEEIILNLVKKDYLDNYYQELKNSSPKWLLQNNHLLEDLLFLKKVEPILKKVNNTNQIDSLDPIKNCKLLIKALNKQLKYKEKLEKLCKKYNVSLEFKKNINNKLLNTTLEKINEDLVIVKIYEIKIKNYNSEIRKNQWSITWRTFFSKKMGIFKKTLKDKIILYTKKNKKLTDLRENIIAKVELKSEEIFPITTIESTKKITLEKESENIRNSQKEENDSLRRKTDAAQSQYFSNQELEVVKTFNSNLSSF